MRKTSQAAISCDTAGIFRTVKGARAFGYDAMLLPMVCRFQHPVQREPRSRWRTFGPAAQR
jgi:hypothetical protein